MTRENVSKLMASKNRSYTESLTANARLLMERYMYVHETVTHTVPEDANHIKWNDEHASSIILNREKGGSLRGEVPKSR